MMKIAIIMIIFYFSTFKYAEYWFQYMVTVIIVSR